MYPKTHGVGGKEGGSKASGEAENPGGGATEWAGGSIRLRTTQPPMEWGGGVESSQENSTPREAEGPRGDETPVSLTASRYRRVEDGRGRGGRDENPPTA